MFRPDRFARLARAHFAEHARGYGWFLAGIFLLQVIVSIIYAASKYGFQYYTTDVQAGLYYAGLFIFSTIFAARYFQGMGRRASGLLALMRPASTFEKWLLAVLVVAVLFPLAFSLLFYVVNIPDWLLAAAQERARVAHLGTKDYLAAGRYDLFLPWNEFTSWRGPVALGLWLLLLQGFAVFGSLYFRNVALIKTVLAGLVFALLVTLCSMAVDGDPDLVLGYWNTDRSLSDAQAWGYALLWIATPVALWAACYLALREREIAA